MDIGIRPMKPAAENRQRAGPGEHFEEWVAAPLRPAP